MTCKHKFQEAMHKDGIGYQWCGICQQPLYKWSIYSGNDLIPPEQLQNNEELRGKFKRGEDYGKHEG